MEREFENKVAVVIGGAKDIGKCICEEFEKQEARVCIIDLLDNPYFVGDLADKAVLERFAAKVVADLWSGGLSDPTTPCCCSGH